MNLVMPQKGIVLCWDLLGRAHMCSALIFIPDQMFKST